MSRNRRYSGKIRGRKKPTKIKPVKPPKSHKIRMKPMGDSPRARSRKRNAPDVILSNPRQAYDQRDGFVRALKFKTYREYLQSDLWKGIRRRVMERDRHTCRLCRRPGYAAHHRKYNASAMLGTIIDNIVCLCAECHKAIEFSEAGEKRMNIRAVDAAYDRLSLHYRRNPKPKLDAMDEFLMPAPVRLKPQPNADGFF